LTYPIETLHPFLRPRAPGHKYNSSANSGLGRRVLAGRWQVSPSPLIDNCEDLFRELLPTSIRVGAWGPSLDGQTGIEHEDAVFRPTNQVPGIDAASVTVLRTHGLLQAGSLNVPVFWDHELWIL